VTLDRRRANQDRRNAEANAAGQAAAQTAAEAKALEREAALAVLGKGRLRSARPALGKRKLERRSRP
jgi:hypothetical protein